MNNTRPREDDVKSTLNGPRNEYDKKNQGSQFQKNKKRPADKDVDEKFKEQQPMPDQDHEPGGLSSDGRM